MVERETLDIEDVSAKGDVVVVLKNVCRRADGVKGGNMAGVGLGFVPLEPGGMVSLNQHSPFCVVNRDWAVSN